MALAVIGRGVEKIDAELDGALDGEDAFAPDAIAATLAEGRL